MRRGDPSVVLIGGWSWHRHVGDDAILRAHLSELGRELPRHDVLVVCGEPERLAERMEVRALWSAAPAISQLLGPGLVHEEIESAHLLPVVDEAVAVALAGRAAELPRFAALVDAISRADAVVAASAGSLTTYYPLTVAEQVVALRIAQVSGKPTAISGASLGPFGGKADAELLGPALAGADLVSVRDATVSPQRARALGVAEERLAIQPDPAFWMEGGADEEVEATIHRAGFEVGGEFGLLTVALWPGGNDQIAPLSAVIEAVAQATRISFLGVPMFVPPQPADDLALDAVRERLGRSRLLTRADPLPDDPVLLGLSKRAQVVV
jgi:polysaccharide pyruvyl transferase WcaK-like protein